MSTKSKSKTVKPVTKVAPPVLVRVKELPPSGRNMLRSATLKALMKDPGGLYQVGPVYSTSKTASARARAIRSHASGKFTAVSRMLGEGRFATFASYVPGGAKPVSKPAAVVSKTKTAPKAARKSKPVPKPVSKPKARVKTPKPAAVPAPAPVAADPEPEPELPIADPEPVEDLPLEDADDADGDDE